jgi:hypothetical protein
MCVYATNASTARSGDAKEVIRVSLDPEQTTGTPRWAYATAIAVVVLAVGFVVMHLAGGGFAGH